MYDHGFDVLQENTQASNRLQECCAPFLVSHVSWSYNAPMAEDAKKPKGGGKLARSEITTVRLDPKLRYLAELAARKHRRTLSSYIEWAIEISLKSVVLGAGGYTGGDDITVADEAGRLWDVDEAERFIKLAISYPELLSHEEQEMWKVLNDTDLLGPAKSRDGVGNLHWSYAQLDDVVFPTIRHMWTDFLVAFKADAASRLDWVKSTRSDVRSGKIYAGYPAKTNKSTSFGDLEDEIPF